MVGQSVGKASEAAAQPYMPNDLIASVLKK
jgi:hypothetical protein